MGVPKTKTKSNSPYCIMPWVHFHSGNHGQVNACCVANIPFGNINTQTVKEIWNGKPIQKIRQKFLAGASDPRCSYCQKIESAGGQSIRLETKAKFSKPHYGVIEKDLPLYFDIRFSNICNYTCRTCWHGASSAWFKESKELKNSASHQAVIQNIHDFDQFIAKMGPALKNAKEIYFAGGEPLITPEHYLVLNWLIENNNTQVHLRYNTNFSKLTYQKQDVTSLWKQFDHVEILASIDAAETLGEYIRKGMHWNVILKNHQQLQPFSHIKFKIAPTISVLNVFEFSGLIDACVQEKMIDFEGVYLNLLERPIQYNIKILPLNLKKQVHQLLMDYQNTLSVKKNTEKLRSQIDEIIHFMFSEDLSKHFHKLKEYNHQLDVFRKELPPADSVLNSVII